MMMESLQVVRWLEQCQAVQLLQAVLPEARICMRRLCMSLVELDALYIIQLMRAHIKQRIRLTDSVKQAALR